MYRTGTGFDTHVFCEERTLTLGGIEIPDCSGLEGHSDADVLCHAVADAVLGAIGEGDLGKHFPPGNPKYKDISSLVILSETALMMNNRGFTAENIDCTVICEEPKISTHAHAMEKKIADALGISPEAVNVKGTSTEGLGFTGRREGIAAMASVLIRKTSGS